jgi:hypothetical protein
MMPAEVPIDADEDRVEMAKWPARPTGQPMAAWIFGREGSRHDVLVRLSPVHAGRAHPDRTGPARWRPTIARLQPISP